MGKDTEIVTSGTKIDQLNKANHHRSNSSTCQTLWNLNPSEKRVCEMEEKNEHTDWHKGIVLSACVSFSIRGFHKTQIVFI